MVIKYAKQTKTFEAARKYVVSEANIQSCTQ